LRIFSINDCNEKSHDANDYFYQGFSILPYAGGWGEHIGEKSPLWGKLFILLENPPPPRRKNPDYIAARTLDSFQITFRLFTMLKYKMKTLG